jgi:hypothetical protein
MKLIIEHNNKIDLGFSFGVVCSICCGCDNAVGSPIVRPVVWLFLGLMYKYVFMYGALLYDDGAYACQVILP